MSRTSTIAIARWSSDNLAIVAAAQRSTYRCQLLAGKGYTQAHRQALLALQAEQAVHRNQPGGYWIASTDPAAAQYCISDATALSKVSAVILASDGVALERHSKATSWPELLAEARRHGPDSALRSIHEAEEDDPHGERRPRAEPHYDKTLVAVMLPLLP